MTAVLVTVNVTYISGDCILKKNLHLKKRLKNTVENVTEFQGNGSLRHGPIFHKAL